MSRGRRESRVRAAPAVSCAKMHKKTHTSIQVQRRQSGLPCAMVYDLFRALPGDRAFLPPSPAKTFALANLTPASGRQDHTASPSAPPALVSRRLHVHRIPPRVRDDREPPLSSGETGRACNGDLPELLSGIFLILGLDSNFGKSAVICRSGCFVAAWVQDCACARSEADLSSRLFASRNLPFELLLSRSPLDRHPVELV